MQFPCPPLHPFQRKLKTVKKIHVSSVCPIKSLYFAFFFFPWEESIILLLNNSLSLRIKTEIFRMGLPYLLHMVLQARLLQFQSFVSCVFGFIFLQDIFRLLFHLYICYSSLQIFFKSSSCLFLLLDFWEPHYADMVSSMVSQVSGASFVFLHSLFLLFLRLDHFSLLTSAVSLWEFFHFSHCTSQLQNFI